MCNTVGQHLCYSDFKSKGPKTPREEQQRPGRTESVCLPTKLQLINRAVYEPDLLCESLKSQLITSGQIKHENQVLTEDSFFLIFFFFIIFLFFDLCIKSKVQCYLFFGIGFILILDSRLNIKSTDDPQVQNGETLLQFHLIPKETLQSDDLLKETGSIFLQLEVSREPSR